MTTHRIDDLTGDQLKRAVALVDGLPDAAAVDPWRLFLSVLGNAQNIAPPGRPPMFRVNIPLSVPVAVVPGWRSSVDADPLVACMRAHVKARLNSTTIEMPDHG